MGNFENLKVWQKAKELSVDIYKITAANPEFSKDYGLKNQIRRSAVSIASNIAEGETMPSDKQNRHYLFMAKASCSELITQLFIAYEIGYIKEAVFIELRASCRYILNMLHRLIQAKG